MTLNGWHRLVIVIAAAWALAVVGLATLEYHGSQGELRDGFFTCGEPAHPPMPPTTRYWNRDCGLFPRTWVAQGLFDDLPPYRRYLNLSRFLLILLGPGIFIGLCIFAVCWIVSGFRSAGSETVHSEPNAARWPLLSARPERPSHSHAEAWLHRLPRRWARNGAIGGSLPIALLTLSFLAKSDGAAGGLFVAIMLGGIGLLTLCNAGAWYFCGLWARYSLKAPFVLSPASALSRITPNWLTGAILLAALEFAFDAVFGTSASYRDWGHLIGRFGGALLIGYLTALVSKWGLRKAIDADRKPSSARSRLPVPRGDPLQGTYPVG